MNSIRGVARFGAAVFALGLSLAGPQAAGVAVADTADTGNEQSASPVRGAANQDRARPITARGTVRRELTAAGSPRRGRAASRSDDAAPATDELARTQEDPAEPTPLTAEPVPPAAAVPADSAAEPPTSALVADLTSVAGAALDIPAPVVPVPVIPVPVIPVAAPGAALRGAAALPGGWSGSPSGRDPNAPVDAPLAWTVLAAARRETFAAASSTTTAIPQTPLFTALKLQEIPLIGPLLVTPAVTIVNHLPVIGDLLHPIFGYPLLPDGYVAPGDVKVVSFDGTKIYAHFLPATGLRIGQTAPTVLVGSAFGQPGGTNLDGTPLDGFMVNSGGGISLVALRDAGYNVITWDPRGEYFSGGRVEIDSPDFEARDASALIDWAAELPQTQLDGPGDPRVGMVGSSYGGGVQFVTAATDHRVDAIVPTIAWNTLNRSYYPSGAFKSGNATLLAATLIFTLARVNPELLPLIIHGAITGELTQAEQDLLAQRGPGSALGYPDLVSQITAPTLVVQGTVDAAFSLQEATLNASSLLAEGVPLKMLWFCGGHGVCINNLFDFSQGPLIEQRTLDWLDRYVKGEPVSTGPAFEWVDQRGQHLSTEVYPAPAGAPIVASRGGDAFLPLIPYVFGSGPMFFVMPIGGTKALNAVNLDSPVSTTTSYVVGAPQLSFSYSGTGRGDHVYAQLVDNTTGLVLGNQVTPIPVVLDGATHAVSVPLLPVAHTLAAGKTVTLQLFSWSADYAAKPSWGEMTVSDMTMSLPTTPNPVPA